MAKAENNTLNEVRGHTPAMAVLLVVSARGQGEAVELAAGLVWRFAIPETPIVRTPARDTAPEGAPAPTGGEQAPG